MHHTCMQLYTILNTEKKEGCLLHYCDKKYARDITFAELVTSTVQISFTPTKDKDTYFKKIIKYIESIHKK